MAVNEHRRPRSSFEQTLRRIASSIDKQPVREVKWTFKFLPGDQFSVLRIKSLWIAGSFARGASHCGDLDLIADVVAEKGNLPMTSTIRRLFLQKAADVRLYIGVPVSNSSGVAFPEAKLIWSDAERNYDKALSNIQLDPGALRYERRTDVLPFRLEQLAVEDPATLEELIALRNDQIIDWSFIPLDSITVNEQLWPRETSDFNQRLEKDSGKKTYKIMRYIIQYLHEDTNSEWHYNHDNRTSLEFGGNAIRVGFPSVSVALLDNLSCSRLIIAPHISKRGPNGLWLIWRGPRHPLEIRFADISAYYLANDGKPFFTSNIGGIYKAKSLELFTRYDRAIELAFEYEQDTDGEEHCEVKTAKDRELLRMISSADFIDINVEHALPITFEGCVFSKEAFDESLPLATADDVIKALSVVKSDEKR